MLYLHLSYLLSNLGQIDKTLAEWSYLKELAKRFNLLTGFELTKIRKIIVSMHLGGIEYALKRNNASSSRGEDGPDNYPNIEFLDVVQEFSHKLIEEDRTGERGVQSVTNSLLPPSYKSRSKHKNWRTLNNYVATISKPGGKKGQPGELSVEIISGGSGEEGLLSPGALPSERARRSFRGSSRAARGRRGRVRGRGRGSTPSISATPLPDMDNLDSPLAFVDPSSSLISPSPLPSEDTASPSVNSPAAQDSDSDEITNWMDAMDSLESPGIMTSTVELQRKIPRPSRKRPSYDTPETMDSETPVGPTRRSKRINLSASSSIKPSIEFLDEVDSNSEL